MIINVFVKPNSKKGPLVEKTADGFTVFLQGKPHDGEANTELIKLLSKYFGIPKTSIAIKSGHKSRHKRLELSN